MSLWTTKSTQGIVVWSSSWRPARRTAKTTPVIAMESTTPLRTLSKSGVRSSLLTITSRHNAATARMLLWIVKKLKKFPFAYPVATLRDANWYVIATIAVAANPSRTMFNLVLQLANRVA